METMPHREDVSLKIISFLCILTLLCSRITMPNGGFNITETSALEGDCNVRIKVINASNGQLIEGASIVLKRNGKLEVIPANYGVANLKLHNQKTWIRTSVVGFYHNEFIVKTNGTKSFEITAYQLEDNRPLHKAKN